MKLLPYVFLVLVTSACAQEAKPIEYPNYIGDIQYDPELDDPAFKICNSGWIGQYYNFGKGMLFNGEKTKINEHFQKYYQASEFSGETGYVIVRFIVNCEGTAGRFRVSEMDMDMNAHTFGNGLAQALLRITKALHGWGVQTYEANAYDYYQHLIFKIEDGKLVEILP